MFFLPSTSILCSEFSSVTLTITVVGALSLSSIPGSQPGPGTYAGWLFRTIWPDYQVLEVWYLKQARADQCSLKKKCF